MIINFLFFYRYKSLQETNTEDSVLHVISRHKRKIQSLAVPGHEKLLSTLIQLSLELFPTN